MGSREECRPRVPTFLHRQGPCLLALILLNVPLLITVMINGHWSASMRRAELALALATCVVLAWAVPNGPVFTASSSDRTTGFSWRSSPCSR
jgi:hypothetical protein